MKIVLFTILLQAILFPAAIASVGGGRPVLHQDSIYSAQMSDSGKCRDFEPLIEMETKQVPTLIRNVTVFNGRSETLLENRDVLLEAGKIREIGEGGSIAADGRRVIEGKGKFLMPGLIDAHVHVTGSGSIPWKNVKGNVSYNLEAYLYAGVMTVYDLGGIAGKLKKLAKKLDAGEIAGPSLYHTHMPITVKNSHPIPLAKMMLPGPLGFLANMVFPTISKEKDAKKLIRKTRKKGVDYIKLSCDKIPPGSPEMPPECLKALVRESHAENLKVFVHIGSVDNALNAVNAGADILAHGIWRDKLTEAEAKQIADSKVKVIYTLAGFVNVDRINKGEFEPTEADRKMIPCCVLEPVTKEKGKDVHAQPVMREFFEDVSQNTPHWAHNFSLLKAQNVPILVGTDSNLPGTYAGATYYQELYELHAIGMSPAEILQAATYGNATLFLENPDFGHISAGAKADILIFDANPLEELHRIENPSMIFKAGRQVKRIR